MNRLTELILPPDSSFDDSLLRKPPSSVLPQAPFIKSPLRYPGGKTRAVRTIIQYIPTELKELCSPFLGGGSIELNLSASGMKVKAYDSFEPLVNFWQILLKMPDKLVKKMRPYYPLTPYKFYNLQKRFGKIEDKVKRAAAFYALNRASFNGTTLSGGMSSNHPRFTENGINNLAYFKTKNFSVKKADFKKSLATNVNTFLYCDPPYMNGEGLYGKRGSAHRDFDHEGLADILNNRLGWILSYNNCEGVRKLYKDHRILTPEWTYGMGVCKTSSELLILSKDLPVR